MWDMFSCSYSIFVVYLVYISYHIGIFFLSETTNHDVQSSFFVHSFSGTFFPSQRIRLQYTNFHVIHTECRIEGSSSDAFCNRRSRAYFSYDDFKSFSRCKYKPPLRFLLIETETCMSLSIFTKPRALDLGTKVYW